MVGMSIDMKFHINIGGDHIDIEPFNLFGKLFIVPEPT
jgi:hypothetical protein